MKKFERQNEPGSEKDPGFILSAQDRPKSRSELNQRLFWGFHSLATLDKENKGESGKERSYGMDQQSL